MVYLVAKYHIAGNFRGRNLLQIGGKYNFAEKTFADCSLVQPKDATLPNFTEMKSHKTSKFTKVSPSKVSRGTVRAQ